MAGAVLESPEGIRTAYCAYLDFKATNNIAEYEALLLGLWKARASGVKRAVVKSDSQIIGCHVDKVRGVNPAEMQHIDEPTPDEVWRPTLTS